MSTAVTYAGTQYNIPAYQDTGYAQGTGNLSSYLIALATGSVTVSGGTVTLTADANFGANFGLVSIYYKSRTANVATAGVLRLANTDLIEWKDNAAANNLILAMNATQTGGGTYTIPDVGVATSASFVMTASAQTIGGAKTFSSAAIFSAAAATGFTIQPSSGTTGQGQRILNPSSSGKFNFYIGCQTNADNGFEITPSTATDGGTFTTPALVVNSSGDVYTTAWTDYSGTSTVVGWSSRTYTVINYKKVGKLVYVMFNINGTSNSTSVTFTLPLAAATQANSSFEACGVALDNGALQTAPSRIFLGSASSTVTVYKDLTTANWTNSGSKQTNGQFWYQTA